MTSLPPLRTVQRTAPPLPWVTMTLAPEPPKTNIGGLVSRSFRVTSLAAIG